MTPALRRLLQGLYKVPLTLGATFVVARIPYHATNYLISWTGVPEPGTWSATSGPAVLEGAAFGWIWMWIAAALWTRDLRFAVALNKGLVALLAAAFFGLNVVLDTGWSMLDAAIFAGVGVLAAYVAAWVLEMITPVQHQAPS